MVVEVDRPNRQTRRREGKSDPTDAVSAARAALSGTASVTPKSRNGPVEQMRVLLVARRSARQQRIQTLNQLRHLVFTAPEEIRVRYKDRYKTGLVSEAANMRPHKGSDPVTYTTNLVIRNLARRIRSLDAEMKTIDHALTDSYLRQHHRCSNCTGSVSTLQPASSSRQAITPTGSTMNGHGLTSVVSHPSPPAQGK